MDLALIGFNEYLIAAYALTGLISGVAYIPQIWTLIKSTGRSISTPISTWTLWTIEALIAFLYAIFILKDIPATVIIGINLLASVCITSLIIYNRYFRFKTIKPDIAKPLPQNTA